MKRIEIIQSAINYNLVFADVANAKSLYIAQKQATKSESPVQQLFKIDDKGVVHGVSFKDKDGDTVAVQINYVRNLSDKYIYISIKTGSNNYDEKQYLVRKKDGAVFAAKFPYISIDSEIQTDYRQNVYFKSAGSLYKMYDYNNGVDIEKITKDYMSLNWSVSNGYLVDPKGNVLLSVRNTISNSNDNFCYVSSGEFAKSKWSPYNLFILKKEPESFYALAQSPPLFGWSSVVKINVTIPELTSTVLFDDLKMNGASINLDYHNAILTLDDMTIYVGKDYPNGTSVLFVMENETSYKLIPLSRQLPKFNKELKPSSGYIYGYNNDEIFRISISTGTVETLYTNVEYSIYDFNVGADNVMTFSALELRKSQDVVCEIRNGQLNVLKTDDTQKIIQLERIN